MGTKTPYNSNKYTQMTGEFEKEMMKMYDRLPELERKKIDNGLTDLVEQIKTINFRVQLSKQGLFTALMAAMYTQRFGESPAATAISSQYVKGGMNAGDAETLVEARF